MCTKMRLYFLFGYMSYDKQLIYIEQLVLPSNPQPIGFRGILLVKRQKFILLYIFLA